MAAADGDAMALQRHLQDREQLLFTSRSISIGEMASTLAHEINQPVGTITNVLRGLAARLERLPIGGSGTDPDAAQAAAAQIADLQRGLRLALDQAAFAGRIVGRIRDFTQARQPRHQALDLQALVHDSVALLDWDFGRHGVPVQVIRLPAGSSAPVWVNGDDTMLQQVVVNLLRNALDAHAVHSGTAAASAGVRVELHAGEGDREAEAEVSIVDHGCGISREAENRLFVPFQSSKPDGMGIGLKICRSFIELHQGRLWFTRNEAEAGGCTFHIALKRVGAPVYAGRMAAD